MLNLDNNEWGNAGRVDLISDNHQIDKAQLLFDKIEDAEIQKQLDKLQATKDKNEAENAQVEDQKALVTFEDFQNMDIRISTIVEAEKVPKTKKLLKLKVDTGIDKRTIVSGIAESFNPEDVIGKQVLVLVNLAPRKIRGVESQGMILMTDKEGGKLEFVSPSSKVKNGNSVN
jgi:methionyl-tRNA synthetase